MDEDLPSVFTEETRIFRFFPSRGAIKASNAGQAGGFFERGRRAKKTRFVSKIRKNTVALECAGNFSDRSSGRGARGPQSFRFCFKKKLKK